MIIQKIYSIFIKSKYSALHFTVQYIQLWGFRYGFNQISADYLDYSTLRRYSGYASI